MTLKVAQSLNMDLMTSLIGVVGAMKSAGLLDHYEATSFPDDSVRLVSNEAGHYVALPSEEFMSWFTALVSSACR